MWPTNAASRSGQTAPARLIGWLKLPLVRVRGTSKDPLMKFPNPGKSATTPFFSRILVEIVLRYVIAPRTKEQKIGVGVSCPGFHGHVMKAQPAGLRTRRDSHSR